MINVNDMRTVAINPYCFSLPDDCDYTGEQIEKLESNYMFKLDVLVKAKKLIDAVNIMGIERDFAYAIYSIKHPQRNSFFKGFAYASKIMSESRCDLRNEKTVEFFAKLAKQNYNQTLSHLPVVGASIAKDEVNPSKQDGLMLVINEFIEIIENNAAEYTFSDADYGEVLATALLNSHRTLQQCFTKAVVLALNNAIRDEQLTPSEEDQSILGLYAVVASMQNEIYFPCI